MMTNLCLSTTIFPINSYWEVCVVQTAPDSYTSLSICLDSQSGPFLCMYNPFSHLQLRMHSLLWCNKATIHVSPLSIYLRLDHEDTSCCPQMT